MADGAPDRAVGVGALVTDGACELGVVEADVRGGVGEGLAEDVADLDGRLVPVEDSEGSGDVLRAIEAGTGRTSR